MPEFKIEAVPELDALNKDNLNAMGPKDFEYLFEQLSKDYSENKWTTAFNHLMLREYEDTFVEWKIKKDQVEEIDEALPSILNKKKKEGHYILDSGLQNRRWKNGKEAEYVVQNYTGFHFMDLKAYKSSKTAATADMIGRVGIKSSKVNNFPVIKREGKQDIPEIIVIKYSDELFKIAGIFTPDVLNEFTSDKLVRMWSMLQRKTAFYHLGRGTKFGPGKENLSMLVYDLGY